MRGQVRADRRIVFRGLGSLGVAAALAGCGSSGGDATPPTAGEVLTTTDDVPVGGGVVLGDREIVVTQPSAGEFKAFTAVCTHQGCLVSTPVNGSIPCHCHGTRYDAATGEVTGGPAPSRLSEVAITVEGSEILAA